MTCLCVYYNTEFKWSADLSANNWAQFIYLFYLVTYFVHGSPSLKIKSRDFQQKKSIILGPVYCDSLKRGGTVDVSASGNPVFCNRAESRDTPQSEILAGQLSNEQTCSSGLKPNGKRQFS